MANRNLGTACATVALTVLVLMGCKPRLDVANRRLLAACESHNLSDAKNALDGGADPNTADPEPARRFTALDLAADSPDIVAALLKAGASPTKPDGNGIPAVCIAAAVGSPRSLQLMIDAGAKIETRDANGSTLLAFAARGCRLDNAALLLKAGADVNARDHLGLTPLTVAAIAFEKAPKRIAMVRLLLDHGADANSRDLKGRTAAQWISSKLFRALGATPELLGILREAERNGVRHQAAKPSTASSHGSPAP